MVRFEVTGRAEDRDLVRTVARTLAEEGADAERLRSALQQGLDREAPRRGGILAALRASPLVDADLDLTRPRETGRPVDL
ncbi:MAG: hypothetical protein J0H19_07650 [Rhodospirillales bacterium]|jgi:hypothetical protein|nr:hypothetical protein [Rhodospirillales bacterium]MBN8926480.1 hypothetical protein [Rhodospirillales bacterium]